MILGVWDITIRLHPNRDKSLIRSTTEFKYLEDSSKDPADASHRVTGSLVLVVVT